MARPRRYPTGFPPGPTILHGRWRRARQSGAAAIATRIVLVCAGATATMRGPAFPNPDDPLDPAFAARRRAMPAPPVGARLLTAPGRAARETVGLFDIEPTVEPALADIDCGAWAGRPFDAIDPDVLAAWIAAPLTATPGGETLAEVAERVGGWLDRVRGDGGTIWAVTHAAAVRAALSHALGVPVEATLAVDVAPLSATRLSFHDRWRLQELRRA